MIAADSSTKESTMDGSESTKEFATLSVAGQWFGVPVLAVQYVLKAPAITPIPLAPPEISGSLNLRGRVVTAVDMRTRLGLPPREDESTAMCVVVEHGHELYSLVADKVGDVLSLPESDCERSPATLDPEWADVSGGLYRLKEKLLVVLDVSRVLEHKSEAA